MKKYEKSQHFYLFCAWFSAFVSDALAVILQFFKGTMLDEALAGNTALTLKYSCLLLAFILGEIFFYFAYKQFGLRFAVGCTKLLKRDIFAAILQRDYVSYKTVQQGEYLATYSSEADLIKVRRFEMLPCCAEILCKIIFVSTALFILDWRLALITLALLSTPLYVPKLIAKRLQKAQKEYIEAIEQNLAMISDYLQGFEIIKNFALERKILHKFTATNDTVMAKLQQEMSLNAVAQLLTTLISYLSYFIVLISAASLVWHGNFSAGDFFVAIGMIDQLSHPLISLATVRRLLVAVKPTCRAMEEFVAVSEEEAKGRSLINVHTAICYRNVDFAYPDRPLLIQNFCFTAEWGKRYLLKGASGSGKTTLVNLLLRYYDVCNGSIEIDGVPLAEYASTYEAITIVRQDAVLFHGTLRDNLSMYREIPDAELIKLLENLGLTKFATERALGELIAENGANLSGGEKKRICLARALLCQTDVLILDEPLANLDTVTADKIEDLLLAITGRLLIVVSHHFSEDKLAQFDHVICLP